MKRLALALAMLSFSGWPTASAADGATVALADGSILQGELEGTLVLRLGESVPPHEGYVLVPGRGVSAVSAGAVSPFVPSVLIVADHGAGIEHSPVIERFARESGPGEIHLALDLPPPRLAVDVHGPLDVTPDELARTVERGNMKTFARFQFGERGAALFERLAATHALLLSRPPATRLIGSFGADGKFVSSVTVGATVVPVERLKR